ncbi:WD40 repeat domain-containing serine/threonine protein kinase [Nonomuraea lactucae]|uniref:WD40 repeat domain-containing serine/threonine protein kinase n=1 Tax=Nonomuraea lactucae TaxID=2249762 RepID=UPI000DE2A97F|nr:WD40 repeat domain-containing serine/threonine-protein kinase [Nonomuraea lactucae]
MKALIAGDPDYIGGYWLAGRLGAGGQGVVYEAYDAEGHRVALKVLHAADDSAARGRFAKEAVAAGRVASFCTARVLAAEVEGRRPFIVSEYVPGPSLRQAVLDGRTFTHDDLYRLATAVVTALTAIHEAGVIHRDLKPDNVLLGPDGPRVIDFGIARAPDMSLTKSGEVVGTPSYLAPEVFTGERAGTAADVFAWGASMLFAAAGRDPFHADSLGGVMHRVLAQQPDLTALPARLAELVGAAMRKDPSARPSARDLLLALVGSGGGDVGGLLAAGTHSARGVRGPERVDPELGTIAEDAYGALSPDERSLVAEIFLRFVAVSEDGVETGRSASREELFDGRGKEESKAIERILDVFSYLISERDGELAMSRPALLRAWPRLRMWLEADRAGLAVLAQVRTAVKHWEEFGRKDGDLLHGSRLERALTWAATERRHVTLTPRERDFLQAGTAFNRRRTRRRRLVTVALAGLLVLALAAGGLAIRESRTVIAQRDEATARRVALKAGTLRTTDPVLAMLLSVAGWRLHDDIDTRSSLVNAMHQQELAVFDDSEVERGGWRALSGDGRTLAVAGPFGVRLFDVRTGRRVGGWDDAAFRTQVLRDTALSRSGRLLAVASEKDVTVWDTATGRRRATLRDSHLYLGVDVEFTDHEPTLAIAPTYEGMVHLWNVAATPEPSGLGKGWKSPALPVVSPSGDLVAVAGAMGSVTFLREGRPDARLTGACRLPGPQQVAFSPDGTAMACANSAIQVYDTATGRKTAEGEWSLPDRMPGLRFSPDGRRLIGWHGKAMAAWTLAERRQLLHYQADSSVADARPDPDGRVVRVLGKGIVSVGLRPPVQVTRTRPATAPPVLSGDGRLLAIPGAKSLGLWDVRSRQLSGQVRVSALRAAFSPARKILVTGSAFSLEAWDLATGRRLWRVPFDQDLDPGEIVFSPDGALVAVGQAPFGDAASEVDTPGELLVVDARTGRKVLTSPSMANPGAFSRDGKSLVTADAQVIDIGTGSRTRLHTGPSEGAVAVSSAGMLAADGGEGRVELWSLRDRRALRPLLRGVDQPLGFLTFDAAGSVLVGANESGTVQVWDLRTGRRVGGAVLSTGKRITSMGFDGSTVSLADAAGWVHEITVDPAVMVRDVCARAGRTLTPREWERELPEVAYRDVCDLGRPAGT